jgi:hypothetical protein
MAQTDFRTALQGVNEVEITVTGRTSGRSLSYPVWFTLPRIAQRDVACSEQT